MARESNWSKQAKILLRTGEIRAGMNGEELAAMIGVSTSTYYNRRRNPGSLTLEEFQKLIQHIRLSPDEIMFMAAKR